MTPIAHFNGQLLPIDRISISPLDRGFIFGDGVYEVIPVYDGVAAARARALRAPAALHGRDRPSRTRTAWTNGCASPPELLRHHSGDQAVYIQVTRGAPTKRDHVIPKGPAAHRLHDVEPHDHAFADAVENGVACVTSPTSAGRSATSSRPRSWATCSRGRFPSRRAPPRRSSFAMASHGGLVVQRFVVKDGVVAAPPRDNLILMGITYDLVMQLARDGAVRLRCGR
jgi:D-alanine transaminase